MSLVYSDGKEFHIDLAKGEVGRYAILPGDPGRCEKIAQYLDNPRKIAQKREYAPIEYPAVAHYEVVKALEGAAHDMQAPYHIGVVQCKDNFYGQHSPETMPCRTWLTDRWEAWKACGALASEMESAALFVTASVRRVRMGTVLLVLANQTRREMGLEDVAVYDTDLAVKTAVAGIRRLIESDRTK